MNLTLATIIILLIIGSIVKVFLFRKVFVFTGSLDDYELIAAPVTDENISASLYDNGGGR